MATIKDFYTTSPADLEPGDVMVATVTLHVLSHGPYVKLYRCRFNGEVSQDGVPQGESISGPKVHAVVEALFPAAIWAGLVPLE